MASLNLSAKPLLIIVGPTAVGKTAASVEMAKALDGEIISADSMQVYRGMDIGTGKVKPEETHGVVHHLLDVADPGEPFSVAQYVELADEAIRNIVARNHLPIVVGGTGLYVRSLIEGFLFEDPGADYEFRKKMQELADKEGPDVVHSLLEQVDPEAARRIHQNDLKRTIRALEVYHTTGETISEKIARSKQMPARYPARKYALTAPRDLLYERINTRVDLMLEEGLVQEVMGLLIKGFGNYLTSTQAIGYKEIINYLSGEISYHRAVEELKQATRNYAKRQLSWFRADPEIQWFDITEYADKQELVQALIEDFKGYLCHYREINGHVE